MTKRTLDKWGGVGSILAGIASVRMMWVDVEDGFSMWRVWATVSVLLVLNGIAMVLHSRRSKRTDRELREQHRQAGGG